MTTDRTVLDEFISVIRAERPSTSKPQVTTYTTDTYGWWSPTKTTVRRTLDALILPAGIKEALVDDVKEFRVTQSAWSVKSGVPLRRGYLLYGPEGTGKRTTILALAAELGVGVYTISLSDGTYVTGQQTSLLRTRANETRFLAFPMTPASFASLTPSHHAASFSWKMRTASLHLIPSTFSRPSSLSPSLFPGMIASHQVRFLASRM